MNRYQQTGYGLGTDIVLTINSAHEVSDSLFTVLWSKITSFEAQFSRFKTTSELTLVNTNAGDNTQISDSFMDLLQAAIAYSNQTDGLYNPLLLGSLQKAGYKGSWPSTTQSVEQLDFSNRDTVNLVSDIKITESSVQIPAGSALDFGGIGKGYLLDLLADYLDAKHVKHYWISLGGDIVINGNDITNEPWRIGIAATNDTERVIETVSNDASTRMAIATSGITRRRGVDWHHILDPRTGKPAKTDLLSATVMHPSAAAADIFAKCLIILGSARTEEFTHKHGIVTAITQTNDNNTLHY